MQNLSAPLSEQSKDLVFATTPVKKKKVPVLEAFVALFAVGVIVILILLTINPEKADAEARNLQRQTDVLFILSEVSTYTEANDEIPNVIPFARECVEVENEVCRTGPYECEGFVNLEILNNPDSGSIINIPSDPMCTSANGTGYYIFQDGEGGVTVCAPHAERDEDISFTKYLY